MKPKLSLCPANMTLSPTRFTVRLHAFEPLSRVTIETSPTVELYFFYYLTGETCRRNEIPGEDGACPPPHAHLTPQRRGLPTLVYSSKQPPRIRRQALSRHPHEGLRVWRRGATILTHQWGCNRAFSLGQNNGFNIRSRVKSSTSSLHRLLQAGPHATAGYTEQSRG